MREIEESLRRARREHAAARDRCDAEAASLIARAILTLQAALDGPAGAVPPRLSSG